jgi:hypothetical protein
VEVDGPDLAGKTTLANEIVEVNGTIPQPELQAETGHRDGPVYAAGPMRGHLPSLIL